MTDLPIKTGDIVCSKAGHDKALHFAVIAVEGEYALICDGKRRKIEKPKRKKIKHLKLGVGHSDKISATLGIGAQVTNKQLRYELSGYTPDCPTLEGSVSDGKG